MLSFMNITKALSDENRIRILMALHANAELCVCNINELLQLAPSTVSKHLFLLKNARLVKVRKDGRWMYYRLNRDQAATEMVTHALAWVIDSTYHEPGIKADREKLAQMLSVQLDSACSP
jgi:ArsR family transcriptional regulator, arsenate/arsenite/antimonite-responsive transcriptional repressor